MMGKINFFKSCRTLAKKAVNAAEAYIFLISGFRHHNCRKAAVSILIMLTAYPVIYTFLMICTGYRAWYMVAADLILTLFLAGIAVSLAKMLARARFTSGLPETLKIINSRFLSRRSMAKAISATIEQGDLKGPSKRVMSDIRDVLLRNDMKAVEETFSFMVKAYNDYYLRLFLNLVKQAHFKGGCDTVREQLEDLTEEILSSMENRKDLASASGMYMVLTALIPLAVKWVERYNLSAAGAAAVSYYESPAGFGARITIYFVIIFFTGVMMSMAERGSV